MTRYVCEVCGIYEYDDVHGDAVMGLPPGTEVKDFPEDWRCPFCLSPPSRLVESLEEDRVRREGMPGTGPERHPSAYPHRPFTEQHMDEIHWQSVHGETVRSSMRTHLTDVSWDDILLLGAQLHRLPLDVDHPVALDTVIGPKAGRPMLIDMPVFVTHMSFGALSQEAKKALAIGSALRGTAIGSGEGGVLPEELDNAHRYIFELVPNRYSYSPEILSRVHAVELKIGQSSSPGLGAILPAEKVTPEIASIRGYPPHMDIRSPSLFPSSGRRGWLRDLVDEVRSDTDGIPVGVKIAAGHVERDLEVLMESLPDFITVDGRPGGTGSAPLDVKNSFSLPTMVALDRARSKLDEMGARDVTLVVTGGLRTPADVAKAIAMGADAAALGTAALMAIGCEQNRICHTGRCPTGIATQDPDLRRALVPDYAGKRLAKFLGAFSDGLRMISRMTGRDNIHSLEPEDLVSVDPRISSSTRIRYMGARE